MARPKVCVRGPSLADCLRTDPLPGEEGHQVAATPLPPFTASVKSDLMNPSTTAPITQCQIHAPRPRWAADQVKTEQNCSPKQGEKQISISATISSIFPAPEGLQATAPAIRPGTLPPVKAKEDNSFSPRGGTSVHDIMQQALERELREEREQNRSSASTGDNQKPRAERIHLSDEDLVSDSHMRLEDKAAKLQVSTSFFKKRRRAAGLGRWPGRAERARIKHAQSQAHA